MLPSNHIALTSCHDLSQIMLPTLKQHGITVFNYYRIYFNGSVIRLSTDRNWTEHYFKKNYINQLTVPQTYLANTNPINYFIWLTDDCPEMLLDAAINFNTSNGISIAEKNKHYIEYYAFATTTNNTAIINHFYINNLDLLKKYCWHFKEKASQLLKQGEKNKILLLNQTICQHSIKEKYLALTTLSNRQHECARLLMQGMRYKEIAHELNLSPRTIETYINNLKGKLKCKSRAELIIKLTHTIKLLY